MINALGLLEVKGFTAGIEAADAMLKAAQVRLLSQTHIPPGLITLIIEGDLAACRAALDAGVAAAGRVGIVISRKEIGRPETDTEWFVTSLQKQNQAEVNPPANNITPKKATVTITKQDKVDKAEPTLISTDEKTTEITETALLSYIAEHPQGRNITEIMTLLNIPRMDAKRLLDNFISQGKLRKRGNRYSLVEVTK